MGQNLDLEETEENGLVNNRTLNESNTQGESGWMKLQQEKVLKLHTCNYIHVARSPYS